MTYWGIQALARPVVCAQQVDHEQQEAAKGSTVQLFPTPSYCLTEKTGEISAILNYQT